MCRVYWVCNWLDCGKDDVTTISKDEVVRLAREAGSSNLANVYFMNEDDLERFATLCRADLVAEINENDALRDRLSELLTGTANALKGNPGEDRLHDWSDLPKVAADLVAENENLCTVMMAAAVEISEHWDAHCDDEGYGPVNLLRRLENGYPEQYGYDAQSYVRVEKERDALRADAERYRWIKGEDSDPESTLLIGMYDEYGFIVPWADDLDAAIDNAMKRGEA